MNGQVLTKFDNSNDAHEVYEATCGKSIYV
jgi:hypothetical protein